MFYLHFPKIGNKNSEDLFHFKNDRNGGGIQGKAVIISIISNHSRSYSIQGCFPSKFVFYQRSSSIKVLLPSKVVFHQWSSSIKGYLPSKVVFHQRSSSIKGRLLRTVVFHQRSSSIFVLNEFQKVLECFHTIHYP